MPSVLNNTPGTVVSNVPTPPHCSAASALNARLQITIDKKRRMERQQHTHQEPKLIGAHVQLQKNEAQTNAARHPNTATMMSVVVTVNLRVMDARPPQTIRRPCWTDL